MTHPAPESDEAAKARGRRTVVLALGLVAFVVLVFVITVVRLGANAAHQPL